MSLEFDLDLRPLPDEAVEADAKRDVVEVKSIVSKLHTAIGGHVNKHEPTGGVLHTAVMVFLGESLGVINERFSPSDYEALCKEHMDATLRKVFHGEEIE